MSAVASFVGNVLPYITIAVFIIGIIYRIWSWTSVPVPLKIPVTPAPKTNAGIVGRLASEVLIFRSLFSSDKALWIGAWPFHAALALIIIGHGRVFSSTPDNMLSSLFKMTHENIDTMSLVLGGGAGVIIIITAIYLLFRRPVLERVRYVSTFADYFVLLLLIGIIVAGNYLRFAGETFDLDLTRQYFVSVAAFRPELGELATNTAFLVHYFLVQLLLIYLPFSKLMHLGGIFFSPSINQKDDARERRFINPWDK